MTDKKTAIAELQQWLRNIQKSESDSPAIIPDGIFSPETTEIVKKFQQNKGLEATGIVDYLTWELIKQEDALVTSRRRPPKQVAPITNEDLPLVKGMNNEFTQKLKIMLNSVAERNANFSFLDIETEIDDAAVNEIKRWQRVAFFDETGVVDKETWNSLADYYLLKV